MKVEKPFTTRLRRFKPGAEIAPGDDLAPHTITSLQASGYVEVPGKTGKSKKPATRRT